jgi:hypothetical protein
VSKKLQRAFFKLGYHYNQKRNEKIQALKSEVAILQVYLALNKDTGHIYDVKQIDFLSEHTRSEREIATCFPQAWLSLQQEEEKCSNPRPKIRGSNPTGVPSVEQRHGPLVRGQAD